MRGFWCAERLVKALEAGQPTPVVRPGLAGATTTRLEDTRIERPSDAGIPDTDPYGGEDETPPARTRFTPLVAALALGVLLGVAFMLVVTYRIH